MSSTSSTSFNQSISRIMSNLKEGKDVAASLEELNSLPIGKISFKMLRQLDELIATVTRLSGSARQTPSSTATPVTTEISTPEPMEEDTFKEHQHQRAEKRKFHSAISMEPAHKRERF